PSSTVFMAVRAREVRCWTHSMCCAPITELVCVPSWLIDIPSIVPYGRRSGHTRFSQVPRTSPASPPSSSTADAPPASTTDSPPASTAAAPLGSPLPSTRTLHFPPHIDPPRRRKSSSSASSRRSRRVSSPSPRRPTPACEPTSDGRRESLRRTDAKKSPLSSTYLTRENERI